MALECSGGGAGGGMVGRWAIGEIHSLEGSINEAEEDLYNTR